jgi:SAM-dependent methyltransferase
VTRSRENKWEEFAQTDPYFFIDTAFERIRNEPDAVDRFYEAGRSISNDLLSKVAEGLPRRSLAVEIGSGAGRLLLGLAGRFERVRAVDVAPRMLSIVEARASKMGLQNVEVYLPQDPWDEPEGSADYIYSYLVFQHIPDRQEITGYIARIGRALRPQGVTQIQFDTRPRTLQYRLRVLAPDRLLPPTQRRGIRRIRRDPTWIREQIRASGLEIISERGAGSTEHWFVARRTQPTSNGR